MADKFLNNSGLSQILTSIGYKITASSMAAWGSARGTTLLTPSTGNTSSQNTQAHILDLYRQANWLKDNAVRHDINGQGLTATQQSYARTNIGAGTGNGTLTGITAGTGISVTASATSPTVTHADHTGDVTGSAALTIVDGKITTAKIANNAVTIAKLPSGASSSTFLRGDGAWATPANTTYSATGAAVLRLATSSSDYLLEPYEARSIVQGLFLDVVSGTCSTAAGTAAKSVTSLTGFADKNGTIVAITFSNGNSSSSPTLSASASSSAGASYPLRKMDRTTAPLLGDIPAGYKAYLFFDSEMWILLNPANLGTTATTAAVGNHTHSNYSLTSHTHAYADYNHNHNASDINAGSLSISVIPTGTSSSTVALGNHTHAEQTTVSGAAWTTAFAPTNYGASNPPAAPGSRTGAEHFAYLYSHVEYLDSNKSSSSHTHSYAPISHHSSGTDFGQATKDYYGHLKQTATARTSAVTSDTLSLGSSYGQYALSVTHMGSMSSVDLNNFTAHGDFLFYSVSTRSNFSPLPAGANTNNPSFFLEVRQFGYNNTNVRQRLMMRGVNGNSTFNVEFTRQYNQSVWTGWKRIVDEDDLTWSSIQNKPSTFSPAAHNHDASYINSGQLTIARIPTGTSSSTVALGNHTHSAQTTVSGAAWTSMFTPSDYGERTPGDGRPSLTGAEHFAYLYAYIEYLSNNKSNSSHSHSAQTTATTQATSSNSTSIATTAFVKSLFWSGTQAQYNAIGTKDANIQYNITDPVPDILFSGYETVAQFDGQYSGCTLRLRGNTINQYRVYFGRAVSIGTQVTGSSSGSSSGYRGYDATANATTYTRSITLPANSFIWIFDASSSITGTTMNQLLNWKALVKSIRVS